MDRQYDPRDSRPPQPPRPDYPSYAPGVGYTPPYQPPPPPTGWQAIAQRYDGLRQRARANSMAWWRMKAIQGVLLGGGPFALGVALVTLYALLHASMFLAATAVVLLIAGMLIMLRYALAPATCQWIVTVPENRYCVVEDGNGYTVEYLEPGRMIVPWRWHARVLDYADFNTITTNDVIKDALGRSGLGVDVEIAVVMSFNPVQADPRLYARLRAMTTKEEFQRMIAREARDVVRKYLAPLPLDEKVSALRHPDLLENMVIEHLERQAAMGLTLASSRPVMVYVNGTLPPAPDSRSVPPPAPAPEPEPRPTAPAVANPADASDSRPAAASRAPDTPHDPLAVRRERRDRRRNE